MDEDTPDPAGALIGPDQKPLFKRGSQRDPCPQCGAPPKRRVLSGGFGTAVHDVCGNCGHDFAERTLW